MRTISMTTLVSLSVFAFASAEPPLEKHFQIGSSIAIELTGAAADAYLRLQGEAVPDATVEYGVPLDARITAIEQGNLHTTSAITLETQGAATLLTVEVKLPVDSITIPTGYFQPRSRNANKLEQQVPRVHDRLARLPQAKVTRLEDVRLRRWSLEEEITQ